MTRHDRIAEAGRWWTHPWSLVDGCTPVSAGCERCWSAALAYRFDRGGETSTAASTFDDMAQHPPHFIGKAVCREDRLGEPLRHRKRRVYAVWNDLCHPDVPGSFIDRAFAVMVMCPQHTFVILTKRPERMDGYLNSGTWLPMFPVSSVFLGTSAENQETLDARMPPMMQLAAAGWPVILSLEPLLGPVDLTAYLPLRVTPFSPAERAAVSDVFPSRLPPGSLNEQLVKHRLAGVILGAETGPGARPMHPEWVRRVRDDCAAAGVGFFFKGWGQWVPGKPEIADPVRDKGTYLFRDGSRSWGAPNDWKGYDYQFMRRIGRRRAGRVLDGRTHDELAWKLKQE